MKKKRSGAEVFSLAFLDIITCGLGAMILLLLITKPLPLVTDAGQPTLNLSDRILQTIDSITNLQKIWDDLVSTDKNLPESNTQANISVENLDAAIQSAELTLEELKKSNLGLELVKESLQRATIQATNTPTTRNPEVGGIPVEREYVIFIIDNSGSMSEIWGQVVDVIDRILDIHPEVKGYQVMNDNGQYLIGSTKRAWLNDSQASRGHVLSALDSWITFSSSSPVEGLEIALRSYSKYLDKTSIYIFGDDFTGSSYQKVLETLEQLNQSKTGSDVQARVHGVGFISNQGSMTRYGTLMRAIAERNHGTFLGLPRN